MKGSQAQPHPRIRLTGRFSDTFIRFSPTNLNNKFSFLQLNCHNRKDTTLSVLNNEQHHIALLLQEPWVYHHDLQPPTHQAWRRFSPIINPQTQADRPRSCIYIRNFIPSKNISSTNTKSQNITQVAISVLIEGKNKNLTLLALYNPPSTFIGIQELEQRLAEINDRHTPIIIVMDSNLHHRLWNPKGYPHQHPQSRKLISLCGRSGFKMISPKGQPTFMGAYGSATTIDLTRANSIMSKLISQCNIQLENHSSDHQPIITELNLEEKTINFTEKHISMRISMLNKEKYIQGVGEGIKQQLPHLRQPTVEEIETNARKLSDLLQQEYLSQGKSITTRANKQKAWWDKKILNPIMKERNRARRWMLLTRSEESKQCYKQWQELFREKVEGLKRTHWRRYLATTEMNHAFKVFKLTKPKASGEVLPLKDHTGTLTNDKDKQADLFFQMFAQAAGRIDLSDITPITLQPPLTFNRITIGEIKRNISSVPLKKAPGPDKIPNELIKILKDIIADPLENLFNSCLQTGHFPQAWKLATTVIIQKANKTDYSDPAAYRPIALLNTISKLFERIINTQLTQWAYQEKTIAQGHFGGYPGRNIKEAMILLDSWIKHKWKEKKVVAGLFLDVKSAYPAVHRERLIKILQSKEAPHYLTAIIRSFLTNRSTEIKMDNFTSHIKSLERGLPQGSPLSVTLYLLYNSDLFLPEKIKTSVDRITIGYIDDVTHLIAAKTEEEALRKLTDTSTHSLRWGEKTGSEFDKRKTTFMIFKPRGGSKLHFHFGDENRKPAMSTKWLGLTLDTGLTYQQHINQLTHKATTTLHQIQRISNKYHGLNSADTRLLIKTVLFPRMLFGGVLWLNERSKPKVNKTLQLVFNKAARPTS
ncbi:hypothetical protein O181_086185 [Austropuccinia psidii MF-1]|uniref:Reverse transcriptase domain-containing protein n=1 Tax=Austropuccinia psidii MF-1 TaxID=1389203 RepID=A0A9Q3FYV8_9BASI|nr:hypothetical protein [Austropuccinia psidii MF-1]